jgi:hypothetical protein
VEGDALPEPEVGDEAVGEDSEDGEDDAGAGDEEAGAGEDGDGAGEDGEDGAGDDGEDGADDDGAGEDDAGAADEEAGAGEDDAGAGEDDDGAADEEAGAGEDDDGAGDEEAGCEVAGADDGLTGLENTADDGVIGVGGRDEPISPDEAGLRYALGETGIDAEGAAEDDASGLAGALAAEDGAVTTAPEPADGWGEWSAGDRFAPINAKAATAEPATSPPVMHAEASVRETRCRPERLASRNRALPEDGGGPEDGG